MQNEASETVKSIKKKAIRLGQTYKIIWPLIELQSEMEKQYWNSYHCCREAIQEDVYLRFHYCNKRWCMECNAIRCAKMINGYMPVFKEFKKPYFITLTRPNVLSFDLEAEITNLIKEFTLVIRYLRERKKIDLKGLRKLEVTYNWMLNSYHPHLHLIVDSPGSGRAIINEWLHRNPTATPDAQDMRKADKASFTELFKYAAKVSVNYDMSIYAKDIIFTALKGKRIYQPFGIVRISEDVDEIIAQAFGMLEPEIYRPFRFDDDKLDWFTCKGVSLIETLSKFDTS